MECSAEQVQALDAALNKSFRVKLFRGKVKRLVPIILEQAERWHPSMGKPRGTRNWKKRIESIRRRHEEVHPGFAVPWAWLIWLVVQIVWKWWSERQTKWYP